MELLVKHGLVSLWIRCDMSAYDSWLAGLDDARDPFQSYVNGDIKIYIFQRQMVSVGVIEQMILSCLLINSSIWNC